MPRPVITSVTMLRNEADVLETFVRYHAQILDRMFVADHFSVDTSRDIVARLVAEGLPVRPGVETDPEYQGGRSLSRFAREEVTRGADLVLALDPDEFLTTTDGSPVRPHLDALPLDRVTKLPWRTHVPTDDCDYAEPDLFRRIPHRRTDEGQQFYKAAVPRAMFASAKHGFGPGSHSFVDHGPLVPLELPFTVHPVLRLAHFPVRGPAQIRQKVLIGWPTVLAKANRQREESVHMREMWARLAAGDPLEPNALHELAATYSNNAPKPGLTLDPVRTFEDSVVARYPESRVGEPTRALMQLAEQQAEVIAALRAELLTHTDREAVLRNQLGRTPVAKVVRRLGRLWNAAAQALKP